MNTLTVSRLVPAFPLFACLVAQGAAGQSQASLGLGVSTARYAGGSNLSSAATSPALELSAPNLSAATAGTLASLALGVWSSQGRVDVFTASSSVRCGSRF